MSTVKVKVSKVLRVWQGGVRVRTDKGNVIDVTAPHDKTLKMKEPFCGEGILFCPASMAEGKNQNCREIV